MIPSVAGKGRSFVGAGLYYLHDKKASTRERVAFTHTENLPTRDPDKAIKCMAWTAMHQRDIKMRAGGSTRGNKLAFPVYTYCLAWRPDKSPTQEEMIGYAKESLKVLGLSDHEALFVGHNDEPQLHIHVIVNRVNPETGIAANLGNDFLQLSEWAEQFERLDGEIQCPQRVENNALRKKGEFVKDRDSQNAAEFHRWRQDRVARQHDRRAVEDAAQGARHERERDGLRIARDRKASEKRTRLREATRADWRDLYTIQRKEEARLDSAQRNAWTRVRFFIRTHGEQFRTSDKAGRLQMIKGAFAALIGSRKQYEQLDEKQKSERVFFANKLKDKARQLTEGIRKDHDEKLAELRKKQAAERDAMKSRHSEESQDQAREIREGRDKEVYRQEKREARRRDLLETKRDIEDRRTPAKTERRPTLRERFNAMKGRAQTGGRAADEKTPPTQAKEPPRGRDVSGKHKQFHEQARDTTEKAQKPSPARDGLAEKFRKAREANPQEERQEHKKQKFRDNAKDASRDIGRERSRKPPGFKPD